MRRIGSKMLENISENAKELDFTQFLSPVANQNIVPKYTVSTVLS